VLLPDLRPIMAEPDEAGARGRVERATSAAAAGPGRTEAHARLDRSLSVSAAGAAPAGAIGQSKRLVDTVEEYRTKTGDLQARLQNLQAMLARFADKEKESKLAENAVAEAARDRAQPLRSTKPVFPQAHALSKCKCIHIYTYPVPWSRMRD